MRRMIMLHGIVSILFIGMAVGPGLTDDEAQTRAALQEILRMDKGGIIRGAYFNMTPQMVNYLESGNRRFLNDNKHLAFQLKQNSSTANEMVEVYYDFDLRGLYYVTARTSLTDRASADKLFKTVKEHFEHQYGARLITKNGYSLWLAKDKVTGFNYQIACKQFESSLLIEFYVV